MGIWLLSVDAEVKSKRSLSPLCYLSSIWKNTTDTARAGTTTSKNKTLFYSAQNPLSDECLRSQEQDTVTSCEKIKKGTKENYSLVPLEQGWNTQGQGEEGFVGEWGCARVQAEDLRAGSDEEKWHFNALRARVTRPGRSHRDSLSQ